MKKVIEKYLELINTEFFAKYEKDFAYRIQKSLNAGYCEKFYEPTMVSVVEKIINSLNGLSASTSRFSVSTKSIFIHGNMSQVEFEYYGQRVQRELGDLIFILSVIYNGRKYFEKFTISQFKKDDSRLRWSLHNKEQLYLLSRFPSFKGVRGAIIPQREFHLPNYSGCLGSYNLLYRPGDFVFVSASRLESFIGDRKSIGVVNISKLWESTTSYFTYPIPFDYSDFEELFYIWWECWGHRFSIPFFPYYLGVLGFSWFAPNVHDFVAKYLRGYIGDLTYSYIGMYNRPAFDFLRELLSAIMRKAQKEKKTEVENFVKDFFYRPYGGNQEGMREGIEFDYEGGGFGIIYTLIDLGEAK